MSGSVYDALAPVYDLFNGDADYTEIESCVLTLAERFAERKIRAVTDLGCGTGALTERLAFHFPDVRGVDVSDGMLEAARRREGCRNVAFLNKDAREGLGASRDDLVVSTQDTVSHFVTRGDLDLVLSSVAKAPRVGGASVFDVNTPYRMKEVYGCNSFVFEEDGAVCVWQNEYRASDCSVAFRVTSFTGREDGLWERSDGETRERGWSKRTLFSALRAQGLDPLYYGSAWDLGEVKPDTERAVIAAIKR